MSLDSSVKNVIWRGIIGNDCFELSYDAVIFKNRKKDRELVFSIMVRYFLKGKKSLLPFIMVRSEVCINC